MNSHIAEINPLKFIKPMTVKLYSGQHRTQIHSQCPTWLSEQHSWSTFISCDARRESQSLVFNKLLEELVSFILALFNLKQFNPIAFFPRGRTMMFKWSTCKGDVNCQIQELIEQARNRLADEHAWGWRVTGEQQRKEAKHCKQTQLAQDLDPHLQLTHSWPWHGPVWSRTFCLTLVKWKFPVSHLWTTSHVRTLFPNSVASLERDQISLYFVNCTPYSLLSGFRKKEGTIDSDQRFGGENSIRNHLKFQTCQYIQCVRQKPLESGLKWHILPRPPSRFPWEGMPGSWDGAGGKDTLKRHSGGFWHSAPYPCCHYQLIMFHHPLQMHSALFLHTKCELSEAIRTEHPKSAGIYPVFRR